MNRLAILEAPAAALEQGLRESVPLEDGAFFLLHEGLSEKGRRLLAAEALMPPADAWDAQGEGILTPSARWLSAVIGNAIEARAGLLFIHSHPDPQHPPGLSPVDVEAVQTLGATLGPMLDGPFAAAVVHDAGWTGVIWEDDRLLPIERITAVGHGLRILSPAPRTASTDPLDARQRDALGLIHDHLRSLSIGVVGNGGLGSPIAEQLVRMGVAEVVLVDDDQLDTPSNVRRVFGSKLSDLDAAEPLAKVDIVARHLDSLGLEALVTPVNGDVRGETAFRSLLDTDLVFAATDTHGSRAVINELSTTYLLPVIDVGVRAGARHGGLSGLAAEVRVLTPERPCLWCRGALSGDVIRAENLPLAERMQLEREGYVVEGLGAPAPSVVALTVLGAGLATCALLAVLSEERDVLPAGYLIDGMFGDALVTSAAPPRADCLCRRHLGLGDTASVPLL